MADILQDQLAEIPAKQPPKKRSLFNRPVPKPVTAVTEEDEAVDFFRRSREVFPQHLNEQRRRREKKAAKTERKRSSASIEKTETTSSQEKRRRLSSQGAHSSDEDTSRRRKESTQPTTPSRVSQRGLNTASDASPKTLSGRYSRELRAKPEGTPAKVPEITTLSDTESDKDEEPILITGKPAQTFTIDDDSDYTAKSIALSDDDQSSEDERRSVRDKNS
ncbi:hypothetical protein M7I_0534 [Glarea lozoyensis 74030]|uniref:Uncharacterized protein n=1 Tax=Glarea lozoyensis (strain ATCC 74030 / MF5533) TaxID=1104152 RepID=H0EDS8_GLAL7|nr:hypothetical protein M7I_0534 [Glarea lozoyensis 74030]